MYFSIYYLIVLVFILKYEIYSCFSLIALALLPIFVFPIILNLIEKIYGIIFTNIFDLCVLFGGIENHYYLLSSSIFEDYVDPEKLQLEIQNKMLNDDYFTKLKMNLKVRLGLFYFSYDPYFDIKNHFEIIENVKTKKNLFKFISNQITNEVCDKNHPLWKFFIVKNYLDGKTVFIMKVHHIYGDGLAMLSLFSRIGEINDMHYINLPRMNLLKNFMIIPMSIFQGFSKLIYDVFSLRKDDNILKEKKFLKRKIIFESEPIEISFLKENFSKKHKLTINEIMFAGVCETLQFYSKKYLNKDNFGSLNVAIPVSLRDFPENGKQLPLANKVKLKNLKEMGSIENLIKYYSKLFNDYKNSFCLYLYPYLLAYERYLLPFILFEKHITHQSNKSTALFSCVPGPLKQIEFLKKPVKSISVFANLDTEQQLTFPIFSYNGKITLNCIVDESTEIDPEIFTEEFYKIITEKFLQKQN